MAEKLSKDKTVRKTGHTVTGFGPDTAEHRIAVLQATAKAMNNARVGRVRVAEVPSAHANTRKVDISDTQHTDLSPFWRVARETEKQLAKRQGQLTTDSKDPRMRASAAEAARLERAGTLKARQDAEFAATQERDREILARIRRNG